MQWPVSWWILVYAFWEEVLRHMARSGGPMQIHTFAFMTNFRHILTSCPVRGPPDQPVSSE